MSGTTQQTNVKNNLFNFLLNKFLPFWPLILAFLIACLFAATCYIFLSQTLYETSAAVLLNDEQKGVDDAEMLESINVFKTKKIIENELEILGSKEIIRRVVDSLSLYAPVFDKSGFRTTTAYESSPIRIVLKDPYSKSNFKEDIEFEFVFNSEKQTVVIKDLTYALNEWVSIPMIDTEIKFIPNPNYTKLEASNEFYFKLVNPRLVTDFIHQNVSAEASSKLSTVVRLKYKDELPIRGEDILGYLILAYKTSAVEDRDAIAQNTLEFIESRMNEVGIELELVEKELETYRAKEGVIDIGQQGSMYLQNVGDYDRRLTDIDIQISILNKVSAYVNSKGKTSGIVPSTMGVDDPILSQLLKDLYDAEIEYAKLKKTTAANNPILVSIQNRIAKIRPSIAEIVKNQRSNLYASRSNLSSSSGKYNDALKVLPEQERKLIEITRRKKSVSSLFEYLVQKREETALSYAPTTSDVKIVESPQSSLKPVSPKKSLIYLMAICASLGISMALIGIRELISTKILFRAELEEYLSIPVIGELAYVGNENEPKERNIKGKIFSFIMRINDMIYAYISKFRESISRKEGLLTNNHENIFIVDQFRQILAFLGFYRRTDGIKKLMITSSIQGEGKSYVSANLAQTLAFSGKKVALLDMDLRNQRISSLFKLEKEKGISDFLVGKVPYTSLAKQVGKNKLYVFPAGTKAINSSELLTSTNLDRLFTSLEEEFDYILVDTPPINMVSDAQTLNHFCDKTLVIVRHGFTPKFVIQHLDENVKAKNLNNCAVVFNGVKNRGVVTDSYGFGYGYGYEAQRTYIDEYL